MSQRTEEIADELERIRERSAEDIAVLVAALIGALKSASVDSRHGMDRDQLAAMANSLAQVAAQSGDPENAIAIASIQAEIESLSDDDLQDRQRRQENDLPERSTAVADRATAPPLKTTAPPTSRHRPLKRFAHPIPHLFGLVSICALSYAGYIAIESIFKPGSVASWVLTASSTLLAVSIALRWRRFVTLSTSTLTLKTATATLVLCAGCAVGYSLLMLHPTLDATQAPPLADGPSADAPTGTDDASSASRDTFADGGAPRPVESDRPIALWWMGESGQLRARARPTGQAASPPTDSATIEAAAHSDAIEPPAPKPVSAPSAPPTRQERYQAMLDRDVVVTDATGAMHRGTLTGVSSEGVTLRTEVMMFGEPILAHRLYLYDNVETVEPD